MVQLTSVRGKDYVCSILLATWIAFASMIVAFPSALAQDSPDSTSFLDRFSISLTGSYHYAPWKDLNADHNAVRDEVQLDPELRNPSGSAVNIFGDNQFEAAVGFEIMKGLSLLVGGSYFSSRSDFNLHQVVDPTSTITLQDAFSLRTYMIGPGIQYEHHLSKVFSAVGSISAYRTFGKMHFEYGSTSWYVQKSSADLSSTAWAGVLRGGLKMEVLPGFCVVGSIDYRLLRFREFTGTGRLGEALVSNPINLSSSNNVYNARLVSEEASFGVLLESSAYEAYYPHYAWSQNYYEVPTRNAVLELSGIGGELGIEYRP
ncbi:MAG TPA: hypothetical protein VIS48_01375 [Candidatus Kryptonia bacterium]